MVHCGGADTIEGKVVDDDDKRWSITKLNRNEFMLFLAYLLKWLHNLRGMILFLSLVKGEFSLD